MKKPKKFLIVPKNPQNEENVEVEIKTQTARYSNALNELIFLENGKETSRGWNFTNWGRGSKAVKFFFARGEYDKVEMIE